MQHVNSGHIYISGPLHSVADPIEARLYYEKIAAACVEIGWRVHLPHSVNDYAANPNLTPEDIYENDLHHLLESAIVVAHVGIPSSGVGAEIAIAIQQDIPVVGLRRPGEEVSLFLLGLLRSADSVELVTHDDQLRSEMASAIELIGPLKPRRHRTTWPS